VPRAGPRELPHREIDRVDAGARPAGLRVLQPQHSRGQGRRMHHVPRSGRSDAADVAREITADGVVPRLPPPAGAIRSAARDGLPRRLRAAAEPAGSRPPPSRGISNSEAYELFNVSPLNRPFWRVLEERAADPAFQERLYNEFPSEIEAITDPVQRRTFLKLMGASMALAGVTGCTRQPVEKIIPYVRQPEELIPGRPMFFATAMTLGGVATGLLVESHEGRPTKIEGNTLHPGSLGAADVFAQAAILGLYDPDRATTLTNVGEIRPWSSFLGAIRAALTAQQPFNGAGFRILTESVGSPTLAAQ